MTSSRESWLQLSLQAFKRPFLALVQQSVHTIPIRGNASQLRYKESTHLEFVARILCGLAPILVNRHYQTLAITALTDG